MSVTTFFSEKLLPLLLPVACLACDRLIADGRHYLGLCPCCRGRLVPIGNRRCSGCGRPLWGRHLPAGYRCGNCRKRPPAFDRLLAIWTFRPPFDAVVHGLKFERLEYLGRHLAREMAVHLRNEQLETELVTWVPLHWQRLLGRGYNQAECIARPLARQLDLPARRVLRRTRATPAQAALKLERRATNLRNAFRACRPRDIDGKRVLIVDDVTTSGATLRSASEALRRAGAREVVAVAAGRTPGNDEPRARRTVIW